MTLQEWTGAAAAPPPSVPRASTERVVSDRQKAAPDTDGATKQTIALMCEYIRKVQDDEAVEAAASFAWRKFANRSNNPGMRAWGVFWYVKHCIKFQQDEATMFRIGEPGQQDLLTAPDVLLRMDDPAEDCDGFTMLVCALLQLLGIEWVIVTVAVDPQDRTRWSHVFPMAMVGGLALPLDASHGSGPGWMVPRDHIFRWQAWNKDGQPVDVKMPAKLGHYVSRGRGFGDLLFDSPSDTPGMYDASGNVAANDYPTPASSAGAFNWASFLNNLVNQGASVAKIAETPTTTVTYPGGAVVSGPAGSFSPSGAALGSSLSGLLPWLIGGAVVFAVVKVAGSK